MYVVVGCGECGSLWLLADPDDSDSATCPQCGRRHQTDKLRRLFEGEDRDAARQARARLLATRGDEAETFAGVDHVADIEDAVDDDVVVDEEYLESAGLDPAEVEAAGEVGNGGSRSRDEVVRDAVAEQDEPSEADVVAYASEHGVPESAARDLLERLVRRGEATENGGTYRLL